MVFPGPSAEGLVVILGPISRDNWAKILSLPTSLISWRGVKVRSQITYPNKDVSGQLRGEKTIKRKRTDISGRDKASVQKVKGPTE